jgi:hypothetical protein
MSAIMNSITYVFDYLRSKWKVERIAEQYVLVIHPREVIAYPIYEKHDSDEQYAIVQAAVGGYIEGCPPSKYIREIVRDVCSTREMGVDVFCNQCAVGEPNQLLTNIRGNAVLCFPEYGDNEDHKEGYRYFFSKDEAVEIMARLMKESGTISDITMSPLTNEEAAEKNYMCEQMEEKKIMVRRERRETKETKEKKEMGEMRAKREIMARRKAKEIRKEKLRMENEGRKEERNHETFSLSEENPYNIPVAPLAMY